MDETEMPRSWKKKVILFSVPAKGNWVKLVEPTGERHELNFLCSLCPFQLNKNLEKNKNKSSDFIIFNSKGEKTMQLLDTF